MTEALDKEAKVEPGWPLLDPEAWWLRAGLEAKRGLLDPEQVRVVVLAGWAGPGEPVARGGHDPVWMQASN